MKSILLCGNYGATNLGDEAILDGVLAELKLKYPQAKITVLSYNPAETAKAHHCESYYFLPLGFRSLWRALFKGELKKTILQFYKTDLFILGGGGLLNDEKLFAVILWTWHVFMADFFHKSIWIYANSVGPLQTKIGRLLTKKALQKARFISVRDQNSKQMIKSLGLETEVKVVPDPVFSLNLTHLPSYHLATLPPYIVISLRPWITYQKKIINLIPKVIDWLIEKYKFQVILVPFQYIKDRDEVLLRKIYQKIKNKKNVNLHKFTTDYKQIIALIKNARLVIAMRLHAIIFAHLVKTPFLAINYTKKVKSFLQEIGNEEKGIHLGQLSEINLKKRISDIID